MTDIKIKTTSRPTILVVDDDSVIRRFFRKVLEQQGYDVIEAENGNDALVELEGNTVSLVIADVHMPHLSGIDLLTEIQKYASKIPVIIITGKASVEAAVECMKIGAIDFISKPCSLVTIRETVASALEKTAAAAALAKENPLEGSKTVILEEYLDFLSGYSILGRLGEGNMGIVFLVEKKVDGENKRFALKILKSFDCGEEERKKLRERFFHEAQAASSVTHPNIVHIVEYGEDESAKVTYIVMEYIEGKTLVHYIDKHEDLDYRQKSGIILQVADALSAIHKLDIYHRDIKPGNVIIDEDFNVKITDFGIAKIPDSSLTRQSEIMGSPGYMSPESFVSAQVDNRADIFSLGVMAYELFLGKRPFNANSFHRMCHIIQHDEPPDPRDFDSEFPRELSIILDKMLQKDPKDRYASVLDVCSDLNKYIEGQVVKTRKRRGATSPGTAGKGA